MYSFPPRELGFPAFFGLAVQSVASTPQREQVPLQKGRRPRSRPAASLHAFSYTVDNNGEAVDFSRNEHMKAVRSQVDGSKQLALTVLGVCRLVVAQVLVGCLRS